MSKQEKDSSEVLPPKSEVIGLNRRKFIGAGSSVLVLGALAFSGAQAQDIEKVTAAQHDKSMTDPGPENGPLRDISPNGFLPPPTDLIFIEMFKASRLQDLSLSTWVTHAPAQLVMDHLRISAETRQAIPQANSTIVPS